MLVHKDKAHRRIVNVCLLVKDAVLPGGNVGHKAGGVEPIARTGPLLAHAHAAQSRDGLAIDLGSAAIRRALVNAHPGQVGREFGA